MQPPTRKRKRSGKYGRGEKKRFRGRRPKKRKLDNNVSRILQDPSTTKSRKKKLLKIEKKKRFIPNYDNLRECNKLFESYKEILNKEKSTPNLPLPVKEQMVATQNGILEKICEYLQLNFYEFSKTSNGAHLVRTLIKYTPEKYQLRIFEMAKPHFVLMSRNQKARHIIHGLFLMLPKHRDRIFEEFAPHAAELATQTFPSKTIELLYDYATNRQKNFLLSKLYGFDLDLFFSTEHNENRKNRIVSLTEYLTRFLGREGDSQTRSLILKRVKILTEKCVEKRIFRTNGFILRVLVDFMENGDPEDVQNMTELLFRDIQLFLHLPDGCNLAIYVISYSNVKQRKTILKNMEEHVDELCMDPYGCIVACFILSCVDDVVMMKDKFIQPMITNLESMLVNQESQKVILFLFSPFSNSYLHRMQIACLKPRLRNGIQDCYQRNKSSVKDEDDEDDEEEELEGEDDKINSSNEESLQEMRISKKEREAIVGQNLLSIRNEIIEFVSSKVEESVLNCWRVLFEIIRKYYDSESNINPQIQKISSSVLSILTFDPSTGGKIISDLIPNPQFRMNFCKLVFKIISTYTEEEEQQQQQQQQGTTFAKVIMSEFLKKASIDKTWVEGVIRDHDFCMILVSFLKNPSFCPQILEVLSPFENVIKELATTSTSINDNDKKKSGRGSNFTFFFKVFEERKNMKKK